MSQPTSLNNVTPRALIAAYLPAQLDPTLARRLIDDAFAMFASDPDHRTVATMMTTWFAHAYRNNPWADDVNDAESATTALEWYARTLEGPAI